MKKQYRLLVILIVFFGATIILATYGSSSLFAAEHLGVFRSIAEGDEQFEGYIKIMEVGSELKIHFSWAPVSLTGKVTGKTMRFEANSIQLILNFNADGTSFEGKWRRKNTKGTWTGTKVESSLWPIKDYSDIPVLSDIDKDGLPDTLEKKYGTDPTNPDSDKDSLSDYHELRKYHTNPLKKDSDGDGKEDSAWEERREYAYSIQAIVDLRPPFNVDHMNDFYQDARLIQKLENDVRRIEVILYPEAKVILNPALYERSQTEFTKPTYTKNFSPTTVKRFRKMFRAVKSDIQVVALILDELKKIPSVDIQKDLGYQTNYPLNFHVYVDKQGSVLEEGFSKTTIFSLDEIKERTLFANSMYQHKTRGACGSTSILRGAMLRAAGIPEKTIVTIPLLYTYETDKTKIRLKKQYQDDELLNIPIHSIRVVDHFFNEAFIGNQWVRVDHKIDTGVRIPNRVGIKILESHDPTYYRFSLYWKSNTWLEQRVYQYVSVIEQEARY